MFLSQSLLDEAVREVQLVRMISSDHSFVLLYLSAMSPLSSLQCLLSVMPNLVDGVASVKSGTYHMHINLF